LGKDAEKIMEPVMYHYEAVLRITRANVDFNLDTFWGSSSQRDYAIFSYEVNCKIPDLVFPFLVVPFDQFVDEKLEL
jgi:hypothetical protein